MSNVIQMFPVVKKAKSQRPTWAPGASPLEMRWSIEAQMHTLKCYTDLIDSFSDRSLSFTARSMAKEEQAKLDKMIAEYTGAHGALVL